MRKEIKNYYELREEQQQKINDYKKICFDESLLDNEKLIVWFCNSFPDHDNTYFREWVNRYQKGTAYFIGRMDKIRKYMFIKIFL